MFTTLKQKILLGAYIFVLLSIPIGAYLASSATQLKSKASETGTITKPKSATASAAEMEKLAGLLGGSQPGGVNSPVKKPSPAPTPSALESTTIATSFGPTLNLKIQIDGRPAGNQAVKLFVGIISGTNLQSPQYLLSFTVDVPAGGEFKNLSLAGLTVGNTYTAVLKGDAQIATSSAFTMSPSVTNLNSGQPVPMLSGDLNQDNVINQADLTIAQNALGQTSSAADLNKDGIVNSLDLAIINKNIGQTGATGTWYSTPPSQIATPSARLDESAKRASLSGESTPPTGGPDHSSGYWVWVPK